MFSWFRRSRKGKPIDRRNEFTGAARDGDCQRVCELLDAGFDPNTPNTGGGTALGLAAESGHLAVVQTLIARGAQPNLIPPEDQLRTTPLIAAATYGHVTIAEALVEAGADLNAQDCNGQTALIWAGAYDQLNIIRVLLQAGADPQIRDANANNALDLARHHASEEAVRLLEEASRTPTNGSS